MSTFEEIKGKIITRFYFKKNDITPNDELIYINENQNITTSYDQDFAVQIESELDLNFSTFEEIGINDGCEIYFEIKETFALAQESKTEMRDNFIKVSQMKDKGFKVITFKTTEGNEIFPILVNEKENFEEAIVKLKMKYPKFKNAKIKIAFLNGNDLMNEEKQESQIKDLGIADDDIIVIHYTKENI